nr:right-handed parallel beta-helix repeat-containing protein [Streptomyces sp. SID4948]
MAEADGSTLYVGITAASCSDTGPGTQAQPYCTLQAATDGARPGDTILVGSGADYPATEITTSGEPGQPITITSQSSADIDGLTLAGVHDVVLRGVRVEEPGAGLQVRDAHDITLDRLGITPWAGSAGVEISGASSDVTVSRSRIESVDATGIEVGAGVRGTVITTNDIDATNASGVALDGTVDTAVTSNTLSSAPHALSVSAGSVGTTAENNVLYDNDIVVDDDSATGTTAGYNYFVEPAGADLYRWAGTPYPGTASFEAATGQGRSDILAVGSNASHTFPPPRDGSPAIDSADAGAPGELATDLTGAPRVDDPLTPDTGTGIGYADRGALELQDPYEAYSPRLSPTSTAVGYPVTVTAEDDNPWGRTVTRTYDFGDGTPAVTSAAGSVEHTYTKLPGGKSTYDVITVQEPGHTDRLTVSVNPAGPLTAALGANGQDATSPLTTTFHDTSTSPFALASCTLSFGDGTPAVSQAGACDGLTHTYARAGTYTATGRETDFGGRSASASTKVVVGPVFVPDGPLRILNTLTGLGAPKAKVGPKKVVYFKVNGVGGVKGASSVLLNVTVLHPTAGGTVTAYASGAKLPTSPGFTYRAGQTTGNLLDVPVGPDGSVNLVNLGGTVDLTADVEGYTTLTPGPAGGTVLRNDVNIWGEFRPVLSTSGGSGLPKFGKLGAGKSLTFTALLPDTHNINSYEYQATAVLLDVTATHATAGSYVNAFKPGTTAPNASELNFAAGETRSATVVAPVDSKGRVSLYNHSGTVDLTASVEGFYLPYSPSIDPVNKPMNAIAPARVLDTRSGTGAPKKAIPATGILHFKASGMAGVPAGATGVLLNLTAVGSTANGSLTVWGDGSPYEPAEPALSFMRGQTTSVLVYLPLTHGSVGLYSPYGSVNVVAEVQGYSTN